MFADFKKRMISISCATFIFTAIICYFSYLWSKNRLPQNSSEGIILPQLELDSIEHVTAKLFNNPFASGPFFYPAIEEFQIKPSAVKNILKWLSPSIKTDFRPLPSSIMGYICIYKKNEREPMCLAFYHAGKVSAIFTFDFISFFRGPQTDPDTHEYVDGAMRLDGAIREARISRIKELLEVETFLDKPVGLLLDHFHVKDSDIKMLEDDVGLHHRGIRGIEFTTMDRSMRSPVNILSWFNYDTHLDTSKNSSRIKAIRKATVRAIDIADSIPR